MVGAFTTMGVLVLVTLYIRLEKTDEIKFVEFKGEKKVKGAK
jgi:hypothetical protein